MFDSEGPNKLTLIDALRDFLPIAIKNLKLDHIPKIKLVKSIPNSNVPTFGRFVNEEKVITVVVANRNPVDILRTLAHEMVHYAQGEQHRLDGDSWHTGSPIENEAHEVAGIIMREFDKQFPEYLSADPVVLPKAIKENQDKCPPATQDIGINLKNRQKAINEYGYGPLNPLEPNLTFWMKKVDMWQLDSVDDAKKSLCGNCAAFDQTKHTLDCIAQGIGDDNGSEDPHDVIDAGDLGYCRFLKFKCASLRTCDAWVVGGPITENFADGKGPGRAGDSQRHGIPKGATMAELEKASHSSGRKGQLARWQLNMRRGKKK
jgi:hypothetical protein